MLKKSLLGVATALVLLLVSWAFGWIGPKSKYSADPQIAELEKMRDETVAKLAERPPTEQPAESAPAKSTAGSPARPEGDPFRSPEGKAFRDKIGELTPEQRQDFLERSMPVFISMMSAQFNARYDKFMAMTPDEQRKELDKTIDEMEKRRAAGGGGGPGGGPGGGAGKGGPPRMSPEKMDEFRKKMLDWTTPEMRSKFENSIKMMNDRRKERGLPPMGGPNGGFF